ncbi:uncharacterized protein OCT59_029134 [Rhizophagus irregularis]|uniref:Serine-enriched protein n=1 Tax=Rhizophagus irregularis (strain DAOM 197198w) TaxID=1432141 RepID=A0A015JR90_RHIIW|nr:hypothetical protein RirG_072880 [Rhizophagus irregularis DAOM 197198w]UZO08889.1 hypothetical protein OCT59_029134 [Rhizophagus irregularis]
MSTKFLSRLSQNYIEILEDDEYYDVAIEVGKEPNVKTFHAHTIILCYRSPFLRRSLVFNIVSDGKNSGRILAIIKLPNISPEIFQIILKYIYGGIISLNEQESSETLKILVAADELHLQELVDYFQKYLIENKVEWMERHFELTHKISFQCNSLLKLQKFCTDFMAKFPEKVSKSLDFTSLPEKSLVSLIKSDDLQMKEVKVWDHVLKWGLTQNKTLTSDPDSWTDDDFKIMENTLQDCLPLIRFFSLSSEEFFQKVRPYKRLLKSQLYEELLGSYLDSNIKPSDNILLPRNRNIDEIIDSKIVNLNIVSLISRWIDKIDIKSKFSYTRELYLPYEFELLLRGSKNGFSPENFHTLCDNISHTVTFIKIKGTEEIIGGYNPLKWKSPCKPTFKWSETKDSFIFSFKNKDDFKEPILSQVKDKNFALFYNREYGPTFGTDIDIYVEDGDGSREYNYCRCKQRHYDRNIRNTDDTFLIEDYEVFHIMKKDSYSV